MRLTALALFTTTALAYAAGQVVGAPKELTPVATEGGAGVLDSLTVVDFADQKAALDLLFFDDEPTLANFADKASTNLSADDAAKLLGRVEVAAADYKSNAGGTANAVATVRNVGLTFDLPRGGRSIWVVVVSRGTPTYGAGDKLQLRAGFETC